MNRNHRSDKPSANDQLISALHRKMVEKLFTNQQLFSQVESTLQSRYKAGLVSYGSYLIWEGILALKHDKPAFSAMLLDNSPSMLTLRRRTIFVGILTEEERQEVLMS